MSDPKLGPYNPCLCRGRDPKSGGGASKALLILDIEQRYSMSRLKLVNIFQGYLYVVPTQLLGNRIGYQKLFLRTW